MRRHFAGTNPLAKKVKQVLEDGDDDQDKPEVPVPTSRMLKRRNMDAFLEELKQEHGGDGPTKHRKTVEVQPIEEVDPSEQFSTNVFVGNLPPHVNESMIAEEFGDFGPIGSIKIMWPRTKEQFDRQRNTGFILFMDRADAEDAFNEMQGVELWGVPLSLHWGKPVAKPAKAMYVTPGASRKQSRKNQLRAAAKKNNPSVGSVNCLVLVGSACRNTFALLCLDEGTVDAGKDIPLDVTFQEEADDEDYSSDALSDDDDDVSEDDDDALSEDSHSNLERSHKRRRAYHRGPLVEKDKKALHRILRHMDLTREKIKDGMMFCIEHSDAAYEVLDNIVGSLLVESTPVFPKKIGRLYLLSDVLHNSGSSVPNAWKYRSGLEKRLPKVFEHMGKIWKSIESRLKAEQMRKFVMAVIGVWESWLIFRKEFTDSLRISFTQAGGIGSHSASTSQSNSVPGSPSEHNNSANSMAVQPIQGGIDDGDDIDGIPLNANDVTDEDLDGAPLQPSSSSKEEDEEDIDGVPLQ